MNGALLKVQRAAVHHALHELSQPLTTVSLALTVAQAASSEAELTFALNTAVSECLRAMGAVRELRDLMSDESEREAKVVSGAVAATVAPTSAPVAPFDSWQFGGMA